MRALVASVLLLGGCRQILGFDNPIAATPGDAAADVPVDVFVPGPRKKQITIDGTKVAGMLTGFPVWVALDDPQIAIRATAGGGDIYFTLPDGTPLVFELQGWSPMTNRLEAWVKLDLAPNMPTIFEVHYGGDASMKRSDPVGTFTNNFAAVWHLDDTVMMKVADATNAREGAAIGFSPSSSVPATLGKGLRFDGATTRIEFVNPLGGNTAHTISAWVDQGTGVDYDSILTVGTADTNRSRWFHSYFANDGIAVGFYDNDFDTLTTNIENVGPTLLHWVFEGNTRVSRIYKDGVEIGSKTHSGMINTIGTDGHIGFAPGAWGPNGNTPCFLNGTLDEVRIATVARGAAFIATEYANQSSPSTFYSVGPELVP